MLKAISFRLAPLSRSAANEMIREIRSFALLRGVRGEDPVDFEALAHVLQIMSQLALDFPEIEEAEFNPVLLGAHGALVADVRVILSPRPLPSDILSSGAGPGGPPAEK